MRSYLVNNGPSDGCCAHPDFMGQIVPSVKDNVSPDFNQRVRHNPGMGSWMSEEEFNSLLCERVARLRIEHGWTQQQMATVLGVPHERYKKYETRSPLPAYLVPRLAQIVDRDVQYILTGSAA